MELIECIDRTPESLSNIIESFDNDFLLFSDQNIKRINIIGSGSSYTAGEVAKYFIEENTDIKCRVEFPNLFFKQFNKNKFGNDEIFVFVSQGGRTKIVYESLIKVKNSGYKTIAVSENKDSPIATSADLFFDLKTKGEEYVFRTLGFTGTAVTLSLIGLKIFNRNISEYLIDIKKIINNSENIKMQANIWIEKNASKFIRSDIFILIGNGILYYLAKEFEIKFMEMIPKMSNSYEVEESIHGPQNCFNNKMSFFILDNEENDKSKLFDLFIKDNITKNSTLISNIGENGKYFYYVEYTLFMQYLSYYLSKLNGRDLTKRINSEIDNYIKKIL